MTQQNTRDKFNRPLRDLRISVTDRCNFRCTYCMPAEIFGEKYEFLHKSKLLTFEEIERLVRVIVRLGAVKLRITGGEPLVRQELEKLITSLATIEDVEDIAMTTNAKLLPDKAAILRESGLRRLSISLDSTDEAIFQKMNGGRSTVADVIAGMDAADAAGFTGTKINCVVQRGVNDHTLVDMARFARERGYTLRFIEYMDVGTRNGWNMEHVVPAREILERVHAAFPIERAPRKYYGEVANRFVYQDGGGEIGVIASVTQPFCGSCTRMRLSPEGQLYTCLFATTGTDLRAPLRDGASDDDIEAIVRQTWGDRVDRYSEDRSRGIATDGDKIEMYYIGG
jgi:cyclic pyranopterin phosphate synthase